MNSSTLSKPSQPASQKHSQSWYRPTVSPEHGVYVVLLVAFLLGAAAAQNWTWDTTLALICAFCGFQAEHPLVLQIKQRRSLKPRFLVWAGLYGSITVGVAVYLAIHNPVLLWIFAGAAVAFLFDAVSVFYRQQKSILNEVITFAAVCLSAPFAYGATVGTLSLQVIGLWLLSTLFFCSTIFTVKFRKDKSHPITPSILYHITAAFLVVGLSLIHWLSLWTALAFTVVLLKFGVILVWRQWYCTAKIQWVALLETTSAMEFLAIAALSLLPAHL